MATFFTSDMHFGHVNIISYTNRPFRSVEEMNDALVDKWNEVVDEGDTVWVLGDVAMGNITDSLAYVRYLNGVKLLVPGNHDRCWAVRRKGVDRWRAEYLAAGFSDIIDTPPAQVIAGRRVVLSHFPYAGDSQALDRYVEQRPVDHGEWLLCGHVHDAWRQRGRQINVGVDAWGGSPVPVTEIETLISDGADHKDPLAWARPYRAGDVAT